MPFEYSKARKEQILDYNIHNRKDKAFIFKFRGRMKYFVFMYVNCGIRDIMEKCFVPFIWYSGAACRFICNYVVSTNFLY